MIPQKFHRIWFGTRERPQRYDEYWQMWQDMYPEATFYTWTEDDLPTLYNQEIFDRLSVPGFAKSGGVAMSHERAVAVQRADMVAYEILSQFGGVYLNCDMMPLAPMDDVLALQAAVFGMEDNYFLCNAVMAAEPEHPLLRDCVRGLATHFDRYWRDGMEQATGPRWLTHVWRSGSYDALVLPPSAFYPVHHSEIPYGTEDFEPFVEIGKRKNAYAVHMWGHRSQEGRLHT